MLHLRLTFISLGHLETDSTNVSPKGNFFGRDLVTMVFHGSARLRAVGPWKPGFLLYEGSIERVV